MGEHGKGGGHDAHGGGHAEGHGDKNLHDMHTVSNGMTVVDAMHLVGEGGMNWGVPVAQAVSHYGKELHHFTETGAGALGTTATAIASPLALGGGLLEMIAGARDPNRERGVPTILAGGATATSGGMGLAGLAGVEAAGAYAPVVGAGALGVKAGMYADEDVKKRGWLEDREGNATSIHDWAAEKGQASDEWVTEHINGSLGTAVGLGVTGLSSIAGTGVALGNLAVNAGEAVFGGPSTLDLILQQQQEEQAGPTTLDMIQRFSATANAQHAGLSLPGNSNADVGAQHRR